MASYRKKCQYTRIAYNQLKAPKKTNCSLISPFLLEQQHKLHTKQHHCFLWQFTVRYRSHCCIKRPSSSSSSHDIIRFRDSIANPNPGHHFHCIQFFFMSSSWISATLDSINEKITFFMIFTDFFSFFSFLCSGLCYWETTNMHCCCCEVYCFVILWNEWYHRCCCCSTDECNHYLLLNRRTNIINNNDDDSPLLLPNNRN